MPKPRVAMFGLTTEGYRLAASIIDRAEVTIVDETLQMALDMTPAFVRKNPDLGELMAQEPLLSFKPIEQVLGGAQVVFFTPKLRRPSEEALIEANSKLRDLARYLTRGVTLVNTLPTGPGGNSENIMLVEKQTGLRMGDGISYAYMPLKPGSPKPGVVSNAGAADRPALEGLGFAQTAENVFAAELEYASSILNEAILSVTMIELAKRAREAHVKLQNDREAFVDDFVRHLYDLKAIQASDETGESVSYLAGAAVKSLENYVRYVVDETRELLKEKELKASRTKITLLWSLDSYEMRVDRMQMANGIQQRLRDYVTDVEIVGGSKLGSEVLDQMKYNVVIACSQRDHDALKQARKGHRDAETTSIRATPSLSRE